MWCTRQGGNGMGGMREQHQACLGMVCGRLWCDLREGCCPSRRDHAACMGGSLNFSQFVEGRGWWPWAQEGLKEADVLAGDEPCAGEETYRAPTRFYALQNMIN